MAINSASTTTPTASAGVPTSSSDARLQSSGLLDGAVDALKSIAGRVFNTTFNDATGKNLNEDADWRVRLSMAPESAKYFYDYSVYMSPLKKTGGLVFPVTPTLNITHSAKYGTDSLTHTNYTLAHYQSSEVQAISLSAEFPVQNIAEGQYLYAAIHFLRAATKMFYGADTGVDIAGSPPPLVFLDGYGPGYLPHVPCVVTNFTHNMPAEVDYVPVPIGAPLETILNNQLASGQTIHPVRLPALSTISVTLQPVYSRENLYKNYSADKYNNGTLMRPRNSSGGGFI